MIRQNPIKLTESEIRRLGDTLSKAGLLTDRNYAYCYQKGNRTTCIAWSNYLNSRFVDFATIEEYRYLLENKQYTFLLFDGSIIQLVYFFRNRRIVQHSLGYYSPPFSIQQEEFDMYLENGLTLDDLLTDKITSEGFVSDLRLRSPMRFDFDASNNREDHPATHLHICQNCCRIAISAPLSIGHFIRFIFKHFYPDCWRENASIRRWPCSVYNETIMAEHKKHLHLRSS